MGSVAMEHAAPKISAFFGGLVNASNSTAKPLPGLHCLNSNSHMEVHISLIEAIT